MAHLKNPEIEQLQRAVGRLIDEVAELKRTSMISQVQTLNVQDGDVVMMGVNDENVSSSQLQAFADQLRKHFTRQRVILHRGTITPTVISSTAFEYERQLAIQRFRLLSVLRQAPEDNFMRDLTEL